MYRKVLVNAVTKFIQRKLHFRLTKMINSLFEIFQKIADFGLATEVKTEQKQFTMCGTPNYMAP